MVALPRPIVTRALPVLGAAASAALVALACVVMPGAMLARVVEASGIAALVPAAEPPLGLTARGVLALGGGLAVAAVAWAALYLLFGAGGVFGAGADGSAVRRADAHPDAPPRAPLTAAELAVMPAPLGRAELAEPAVPAPIAGPFEREVPTDLDTPLAALDPGAIPLTPREPVRAVPPLAPGERMQTFTLAPVARPEPAAAAEPASIEALLRRLEAGAERRVAG